MLLTRADRASRYRLWVSTALLTCLCWFVPDVVGAAPSAKDELAVHLLSYGVAGAFFLTLFTSVIVLLWSIPKTRKLAIILTLLSFLAIGLYVLAVHVFLR